MWIQTVYYFAASGSEGFRLCRPHHLGQASEASCQPPRYVFPILSYFLMVELEDSKAQNLKVQGAEDALTDKDAKVFNTIMLNDSVESTQVKLKALQS